MQIKLKVSEAVEFFNAIQEAPSKLFELVRLNVREEVGNYLSKLKAGIGVAVWRQGVGVKPAGILQRPEE